MAVARGRQGDAGQRASAGWRMNVPGGPWMLGEVRAGGWLAEMGAILAWLTPEAERLETLPLEAQRAIDLLQERRYALISAAVTGQIDVRDLTASETV